METLDYYRERSFQLENEKVWLEAELYVARLDARTERSIRRHILAMCITIMVSIGILSAAIATALASPH